MKCITILLLIGLFYSSIAFANNSNYDVLLDASGSMRGFQNEGLQKKALANKARKKCTEKGEISGEGWKIFLGDIEKNAKKTCAFGDKYRCLEKIAIANICLRDQNTDLAGALASWLRTDSSDQNLLIITDNVADTNNKESLDNQQKFKELLSGTKSRFSHIAIITLRLPFNGRVFPLESNKSTKNSNYSKYSNYDGERALVVYMLGRKGKTTNESFKKYRGTIENKLGKYDYDIFQIRPFATDSVKQKFGKVKFDSRKSNQVNIKPIKQKDGSVAVKISNYSLGNPLAFSFDTELEIQGAFKLKDINLESSIQFEGLPEHLKSKGHAENKGMFEAEVLPSEVTLSPNKVQGFNIAFKMDRFTFADIPFKQKLQYALSNTQDLTGKLDLLFTVTREQYEPDRNAFTEWTHNDANQLGDSNSQIQSKVYNLETILASGVADESKEENLKSIPIILEIQYTMGPIISVIVLSMVLLGVLYWLWLKSRGNQNYVIADDMGGQTPLSVGMGQVYKHYDDQGRHLFSLRFLGFAYFTTSRFKLEGSRILGSGESFEIFDEDSQSYYSFYLQQVKNDTASTPDDSFDW